MNRPYIKADIIKQVKLRKIEEEKTALKRQREFIYEQQKQAFLRQKLVISNSQIKINEELEEENGMSM